MKDKCKNIVDEEKLNLNLKFAQIDNKYKRIKCNLYVSFFYNYDISYNWFFFFSVKSFWF
ncbi:hypothetical protein FLACOL7796_04289 [Flavobacterium collinsii]|uniref:Uncharacterized protein n=1 Tax=Flavobacterium collinsii TaxID=1114861 RepID=A0ABM8KP30_9FLAO|nr:hypothetical protein FLACOL7796_04289 [Flavobacterium collinsii]